jgi:hypothetical protein
MKEKLTKLEQLAGAVALEAPTKQNNYVHEVKIPWRLIHKIRKELESLGINWRELQKKTKGA